MRKTWGDEFVRVFVVLGGFRGPVGMWLLQGFVVRGIMFLGFG